MEQKWTDEQKKAICLHDRNLLVSAAAGSGKTAVLVERIIQMITGEKKVDVDSLLVLTFTRAAAAEMKERIALRLNEMMDQENSDQSNLHRQLALLEHSSITTIDSFCLRVVRDYFGELELDPDFRVADEGEKTLLEADCMEELLESSYEEGNPDFLNFADSYGGKKNDGNLEEYIMRLYSFSQSDPYPEKWLSQAAKAFRAETMEDVEKLDSVRYLTEDYKKTLSDLLPFAEMLHEICQEPDGPDAYEPMCRSDLEQLKKILEADSLKNLCTTIASYKPVRKTTKKMPDSDPAKKDYVSKSRDRIKEAIQKQQKNMAKIDPAGILEIIKLMRTPMEILCKLTLSYSELVAEAKKEKNILDFSDIEHFALKILLDEKGQPTAAAKELQKQYVEILVDEYQDSNYLQDTILDAVSRRWDGTPDMFMVGDVKQSIYRFRMARPEIFMGRYDTYSTEDGLYQKINLARNFRSRSEVLEGINLIFRRIMTRNLGDICYDKDAELYPGADYKELSEETLIPELRKQAAEEEDKENSDPLFSHYVTDRTHKALKLILADLSEDKNGDFLAEHADGMSADGLTAQAQAVAEEIIRLVDEEKGMLVQDKKTGLYRKASYKDITILMRTVTGKADTFIEVLTARGIPVCAEAKGYFSALEVKTVLSYLQIIDNPYQDIPLAAVMKSPIWNFSSRDLAEIRAFYLNAGKDTDPRFYSAIRYYLRHHRDSAAQVAGAADDADRAAKVSCAADEADAAAQVSGLADDADTAADLCSRIQAFLAKLEEYKRCAVYMQVQELIQHIYKESGYYDYVSAMPAGLVRKRNLDMLVEKALSFEKTSYHGLYQFVRYIDHLEKYEVDFEQGQMFGEQDDIVRIMSIHKSKGLEFPIVILADMDKQFNLKDAYAGIVSHADFGIAADYIDTEKRCRVKNIISLAVKQRIVNDTMGEELRLLYVAMTRAREALIMTGASKNPEKLFDKYASENPYQGALSYQQLASSGNYLDWILMAAGEKLEDWMEVKVPALADLFVGAVNSEIETNVKIQEIRNVMSAPEQLSKDEIWEKLEKLKEFRYPFAVSCEIQGKFSVSELKHKAMRDKGLEHEDAAYKHQDVHKAEKTLLEEEEQKLAETGLTGADRGTAYHALLELLKPADCLNLQAIEKGIGDIVASGKVKADHAALVNPEKLLRYYSSNLGKRFIQASEKGLLYKEREFIMNIPARAANGEWDSDEPVLIQGIIDAYWEEEDGLVLLDYKTDVKVTEQKLIDRYERQFDLYTQALSQILNKPVKERYIWSFFLGKAIKL